MIETFRGVAFPWLCDHQGHLTTSRYLEMFDVASYHLMDAIERGEPGDPNLGWADVRHEIDYRAEVAVGGLVLIRSGFLKLGRSSVVTRHVMSSTDDTAVHAQLQATTVRFDKAARLSAPIPETMRGRIAGLLLQS